MHQAHDPLASTLLWPTLPGATLPALALAVPAGWAAARMARTYAPEGRPPATGPVIVATVAGFGWAALVVGQPWILAVSLGLGWALVCLAAIDLASFRLPDPLTLPLLAAGLAVSFGLPGAPALDHLAGAAAGYGLLAALGFLWRRWRGVDGIGLGDAKLLAAAGGWLGWRPLPSVLLIACAAAFAWIAVRLALRGPQALSDRIAFGAPLSLATWIVWLHGPLAV